MSLLLFFVTYKLTILSIYNLQLEEERGNYNF